MAVIAGVVFTALANQRTGEPREKNSELIEAMGPRSYMQPTCACPEVAGLYRDQARFANTAGWSFIDAGMLGIVIVACALPAEERA